VFSGAGAWRLTIMSNIDVDRRTTSRLTSNSLRAFLVGKRAATMRNKTCEITTSKPKPRCETCNGCFGLIRHRFAHKQFCSKQCLEQYLAERKQQPSVSESGSILLGGHRQ
jgi:hypothetical protein